MQENMVIFLKQFLIIYINLILITQKNVSYLFFLCGQVPNDPWTGTDPVRDRWLTTH